MKEITMKNAIAETKKVNISDVKKNIEEWVDFLYENYPAFASLTDYTHEKPTLLSVLITLESDGYKIEYK